MSAQCTMFSAFLQVKIVLFMLQKSNSQKKYDAGIINHHHKMQVYYETNVDFYARNILPLVNTPNG